MKLYLLLFLLGIGIILSYIIYKSRNKDGSPLLGKTIKWWI